MKADVLDQYHGWLMGNEGVQKADEAIALLFRKFGPEVLAAISNDCMEKDGSVNFAALDALRMQVAFSAGTLVDGSLVGTTSEIMPTKPASRSNRALMQGVDSWEAEFTGAARPWSNRLGEYDY